MIYKHYTIGIIIRQAFIFANLVVLSNIFLNPDRFFTSIIFSSLLMIQIIEIISHLNKTNQKLSNLFNSIKNSDYSIHFEQKIKGKTFKELHQSFSEVIQTILDSKLEKEAHYQLLNIIIEEVKTGILLLKSDGKIKLINQTALKIFQLESLKSIEDLNSDYSQLKECWLNQLKTEKGIFEIGKGNNKKQLLINVSTIRIINEDIKLFTLQDIKEEVEHKEIDAWQKLIRTISHEIMNSVTPITSLTETSIAQLENKNGNLKGLNQINEKNLTRTLKALKTIENRSNGLYNFVNEIRRLSKIPEPKLQKISINDLLKGVSHLIENDLSKSSIKINLDIELKDFELMLDPALIEQVLINIIINAKDAVKYVSNPIIKITTKKTGSGSYIRISDNGNGIDLDDIDKIFVPFFSTKESGSGIGLSLCKQIMHQHNGTISLLSTSNQGTEFELRFGH